MRSREQRGETLAEVLVSTTLLGIIGIGIIGAIASVLISTDIDRRASHAETVIRSYAAAISAAPYQPCPSADYSSPPGFDPNDRDHQNYDVTVTSTDSWDGAGPPVVTTAPVSGNGPLAFGPCSGARSDQGLQRLVLKVVSVDTSHRATGRATETLTLYKRNTAPPASTP